VALVTSKRRCASPRQYTFTRKASRNCNRRSSGLSRSHFPPNELAGIVEILDDIDKAAFLGIPFHDSELAVAKFFDGLRLAVKVVIMNLSDQDSALIFLDQIDLAIKVSITLDRYELVIVVSLDNVGPPAAVGIDQNLEAILVDPGYPLIRPPIAIAMSDHAVGWGLAGDDGESQQTANKCGFPQAPI